MVGSVSNANEADQYRRIGTTKKEMLIIATCLLLLYHDRQHSWRENRTGARNPSGKYSNNPMQFMIPANEKSPSAQPLLSLLREQIERLGSVAFTIQGTSMLQLFHKGDSITITAAAHPVSPGSILVFWHPLEQFLTSHRVLDYNADTGNYRLKGDNNIRIDPLIHDTLILGQVRLSSDPAWLRALLLYLSRAQTHHSRTLPAGTTPTFGKRIFFALTRRLIWTCGCVQRMLNRNELQPKFEMQPEKHLSKTQKPEHALKAQIHEHSSNRSERNSAKKIDTGVQ